MRQTLTARRATTPWSLPEQTSARHYMYAAGVLALASRPASANDALTMRHNVSIMARDLSIKSTTFSIKNSTPLLILIIVGSIVLAATVVGSLAWVCCGSKRSSKDSGRPDNNAQIDGHFRDSWGYSKRGSVYSFGEAGSDAGLSLREKSDVSVNRTLIGGGGGGGGKVAWGGNGRRTASALSAVSLMPELLDSTSSGKINEHGSPCTAAGAGGNRLVLASLTQPAPVADSPVRRGRGWQLYDAPRMIDAADRRQQQATLVVETTVAEQHDVEAGGLPPARRPSFIDRLLAHRSISQVNASKMSAAPAPTTPRLRPLIGGGGTYTHHDRSFTAPITMYSNGPSAPPPTPGGGAGVAGSALLAAIGGAFRRVSQQNPHANSSRGRKYQPSPRQLPIESDYEGTIGGRDAELPMARRANQRRPLCGESIINDSPHSPAQFDSYMHASPRFFVRSPLGKSQQPDASAARLAPQFGAPFGTPHTPGVAGVGTTWARRMSESSIPVPPRYKPSQGVKTAAALPRGAGKQTGQEPPHHVVWMSVAEQSGPKGRMNDWVSSTNFAAVPPPDNASRRGSTISFAMSERSLPSVSRQNSFVRRPRAAPSVTASTSSSRRAKRSSSVLQVFQQQGGMSVDAMQHASTVQQPNLASLTTTLTSWAAAAEQQQQVATPAAEKIEWRSPLGSHLTDYEQQRGTLWEDVEPTRSQAHGSEQSSETIKKVLMLDHDQRRRDGDVDVDEAEAQRRAEKKLRKQIRQARRAAKQAAKEAAMLSVNQAVGVEMPAADCAATSDPSKAQEQKARHDVLDDDNDVAAGGEPEAAAWVADFLMCTPETTQGFKAPMLAKRKSKAGGGKTHCVGTSSPERRGSRRSPTTTMDSSSKKSRRSPPESPLTSVTEFPDAHGERRSSMPAIRPLIVESRGSQESDVPRTSSQQQQHAVAAVKRVASMPVRAQPDAGVAKGTTRARQLPVPPPNAGGNVPLSAYEALPRAVVAAQPVA